MAEKKEKKSSKQYMRDSKKIYEKPIMGKVTLFADQVLGGCSAPIQGSTCVIPDTGFS
ncbi:MAG: hypothetical protein Q3M24_04205 [Candidatus Electrothrix aestuarii]|uniref:RiPP n=1 Tax=Candidatus Electrothrix aestuarii TaxID=3062594 RepID=A0AAU8LYM1_9BACT|nr:hypothetical protein [Candidatus Electrothrix aestuarii]